VREVVKRDEGRRLPEVRRLPGDRQRDHGFRT
jgi:hypothetical protein